MRLHEAILRRAVEALREAPELSGARVVAQNEQDLAALLQEDEARIGGLAVVVTVDEVQKRHTLPASWDVRLSVAATEWVPINRERPGFATAIDAADAGAEALEEAGIGHYVRLTHTTPGDGVLEAVAEMAGTFELDQTQSS